MARRSQITGLPDDVRAWLNKALEESNFSGYQALEEMLRGRGYQISKSAIHRYGQKIERRFAAIKASTEAARMITEGAADDQDARSEAVIALVQTELFETIVNLQEATGEDVDPTERIALLGEAAKNIANLTRASVALKRFKSEVREAAKSAAEAVSDKARKGGLSEDVIRQIEEQILGIVR